MVGTKIGYLDTLKKFGFENFQTFGTPLFTWWGTILIEITAKELFELADTIKFKVVDNIDHNHFVISLLIEPFYTNSFVAVCEGFQPCVMSEAECMKRDKPWYHLELEAEQRGQLCETLKLFKNAKLGLITDITKLDYIELNYK